MKTLFPSGYQIRLEASDAFNEQFPVLGGDKISMDHFIIRMWFLDYAEKLYYRGFNNGIKWQKEEETK